MKGVILAGGTGTRLGALTRATNKHLLPLGSEPMVFRAIRALYEAGIASATVVTGYQHMAAFADALWPPETGRPAHLRCQWRPGGIADALNTAREFAEGEPVVVLLADNIWERSLRPWVEAFASQEHGARVLLSPANDRQVLAQVAVPVLDGVPGHGGRIVAIEEKPERPASPYAVTGAYAFDETVWDILPTLEPSARGELEITDVLNHYAERGQLEHDVIEGFWTDAGQSVDSYYRAVDFVRCQEAR